MTGIRQGTGNGVDFKSSWSDWELPYSITTEYAAAGSHGMLRPYHES